MIDLLQYDFMQHAILAAVLASIAFGIIGTYVVVKRIVFISGSISHTAYGGIGLGYLLGFDPVYGAVLFSIVSAVVLALMRKQKQQHEDTLIGILWASGMALGTIFVNLSPGYAPNLMSYLFGNILTISVSEIVMIGVLDVVVVICALIFFRQFQAITFDEEFSVALGMPVNMLYMLLYILIGLTTVILIRLVGIILVVALMSIPASIAIRYVKNLKAMMMLSIALGIVINVGGLFISYYFNLASGAAIISIAVLGYGAAGLHMSIKKRFTVSR